MPIIGDVAPCTPLSLVEIYGHVPPCMPVLSIGEVRNRTGQMYGCSKECMEGDQ